MNEDVAAPDPGRVDEVVALREELDDVLTRVVRRRYYEVFLVLNFKVTFNPRYLCKCILNPTSGRGEIKRNLGFAYEVACRSRGL